MKYSKVLDELFWIMLWVLCICLMVISMTAMARAGEAKVSWTAPTQRVDGSALDNLAGYRVLWGTAPRNYSAEALINDPSTLTYTILELPPGTHYFAVTAFDADGLESAYSAEVSKTIITPPPLPPGDVIVLDEERVAYTLERTVDRIALVPVGTVPPGTECDSSQFVRDSNGIQANVVPKSAVVWAGTVRTEVALADCG